MATATVDSRNHISDGATGTFTGDGAATKLTLGWNPSRIVVLNETDGILYKKIKNMAAANTLKYTSAADMAVDAGSAILFNGDGTVTIAAAVGIAAKKIVWIAER